MNDPGREILAPNRISQKIDSGNREIPLLSIVIPAYHEEGNLNKLHEEVNNELTSAGISWELIFVDDGSTDRTWEEIDSLHRQDDRVVGLRLSRNFGHQYALYAGLSHSVGNAVVSMDADLQHPPSVIPQLLQEWYKGSKIVHTIRDDFDGISWRKKITSKLFYKVFSFLSGVKLTPGMADFRLLDRQVVDDLLKMKEAGLFIRGIVQWVGYPKAEISYKCGKRHSGASKYNLRRMLKFAWTGVTSFSIIPLRVSIIIGLLTSCFAFYQLGEALYVKYFTDQAVPGWASIIGLQSLLFGVLFILLGILGEYMARILEEVRQRPRFIISDSIGIGTKELESTSPVIASEVRTFR
jgi:dolichol-phosphate mannosyltransferase